ncbi:MAG: amino acid adenylation domain-containing protein [Cyanobacteria bacterium P01_H01_bin.21]
MDKQNSTQKPQLSAAKRALLAKRLKGTSRQKRPTIPQRDPAAPVPLSFSQQRLWFLNQFEPENPFYNVPSALHLRGKLDISALDRAFQTLVQRHEILRTTIDDTTEQPQQVIHPQGTVTLTHIDISSTPADVRWSKAKHLANQEAGRPFDLRQGPFMRVTLLTLAANEFVLLVTLHHIVSDVWSTGVLVKEMVLLYQAFSQVKPNPLPPLPIQYADFTLWQRQNLQGDYLQKLINYWQQQFKTPPPVLQLPTDRPRPSVQSFRGARQGFVVSVELLDKLKRVGQAADTTLFITLLAAFKALLFKYTGQTDITVGSPIANRNQAAIEGLIGLFMNTLALRTQLDASLRFQDLLVRVRETALGAYSHQDLPFEKLVDTLSLPRELSHTPLFQTMLILQNAPGSSLQLPDLTFDLWELTHSTSKFDLILIASEEEGTLLCSIEYSTDLFDDATIERMMEHFQTLLTSITNNPQACLYELTLLKEPELVQLHQWSQTTAQDIPQFCLHQLFERQVEKTPEATAVVFEQTYLTYRELNRRANRLAHYLQGLGVGPETLVGLYVERSLDMMIGLLGILKAGGAYVPLDPNYPKRRLEFMLNDANIAILITQEQFASVLPSDIHAIFIDSDWPDIANSLSENLHASASLENLAYVIYTSGSTGRPKGVAIPHRGLINYLSWCTENYDVAGGNGTLVHSSIGFDATITGLFAPLLVGKPVILVSPDQEIEALSQALQSHQQLSLVKLTPAHLELLSQLLPPDTLSGQAQALVIGGEALNGHQIAFWRNHAPKTRLINEYGPTETVVGCCIHEVTTSEDISGPIPIGRPIANTQLYVLDAYQKPVAIGVVGELYIGGAGVARGYLNRPELTAEKFIASPFGEGRLYRTGDLVRYRSDGTIEYLGRIDHQIKIRGFRIELGEIEAVLNHHPQLQSVVVKAHAAPSGVQQLVAYGVSTDGQLTTADVRDWSHERLPDYMLPNVFVSLDQMPLTPSGKVDRQALAPPVLEPSIEETAVPQTSHEQTLAQIWCQLLGLKTISIDNNFFELGGDSILVLQMVSRANRAGLQLTPKQLFQHQTIRTLAQVVGTVRVIQADQGPVVGEVPLLPIQHWFFEQSLPEPHHWNQSVLVGLAQPLLFAELCQITEQLLQQHDMLRSQFTHSQSTWTQTVLPHVDELPCCEIDLTHLSPAQQTVAITETSAELQASLDLANGPLLKIALFRTSSEREDRLFITVHHLVVDGVSWRIFLEDVQLLLQRQALPAKTCSYKQWQQQLCRYDAASQKDFWTQIRVDLKPLPVDFPEGSNIIAHRTTLRIQFTTAETATLLQQVPQFYQARIQDLLLTAVILTINQWSDQTNLCIDLESHGRADLGLDISRTVGWFTALYPLQFDLTNINDLDRSLKIVKEQLRRVPDQGLGYGILRYLNQDTDLQHQASASVCFNYLGQFNLSSDTLFTPATEPIGPERGDSNFCTHQLSVDADVINGQLGVRFSYSQAQYRIATVEAIAEQFRENLRSLTTHCLSPDTTGYTPSDLPLAQLDQANLDRLVENYPQLVDGYPLSPSQQGLLFHTLYAPEDSLYVNQMCFRLQGELNVEVLKQTWQRVSEKHSILRTVFAWQDLPHPLQFVLQKPDLSWHAEDWRSYSAEIQTEKLAKLLQQDRAAGFQLSEAPPMRLTLIQLADDSHEVIWSFHHIIMDGWSMPLLFRDVFTLYEGLCQGKNLRLEKSRPYRDYVAWLLAQDNEKAAAFWTQTLQGFRKPTPLSYDKSSNQIADHKIQTLSLSDVDTVALQTFVQRSHLTLNTLVQATWALLLSHISDEQDVMFGATTAGRPPDLAGADTMVGVFINSLPVRVQLSSDIGIVAWLQELQAQQSRAREYEYASLSQIQRWSEIPAGQSLFDSLVVFENYPVDEAINTLEISLEIQSVRSFVNNNYPITIRALLKDKVTLQIMADRTCFASEVTERWLQYLVSLLQWLVEHPTESLGAWQAQLAVLDQQWQQQQVQTLTKTSLKKLRKARRKTVHSDH